MKRFTEWLPTVRKFLAAVAAALAQLAVALSDGVVTQSEWIMVALAFLGAIGVYAAVNEKK